MHSQNRSPVIEHANKCHPNVSLCVRELENEGKEKALDTIECQKGDKNNKLRIVLHIV